MKQYLATLLRIMPPVAVLSLAECGCTYAALYRIELRTGLPGDINKRWRVSIRRNRSVGTSAVRMMYRRDGRRYKFPFLVDRK